ncbi:hypothetical protein M3J09_003574 [Ascochyta lentis]
MEDVSNTTSEMDSWNNVNSLNAQTLKESSAQKSHLTIE